MVFGGLAIKTKRDILLVFVREGKSRYLLEYFKETVNEVTKSHYLNRKFQVESDTDDDLWIDDDYAYLRFRGFGFLYRLGVPSIPETQSFPDDYSDLSVPLPFKNMVSYTRNNDRWIVTVGYGNLNFYKAKFYPPEMECDGTTIDSGTWVYDLKAY